MLDEYLNYDIKFYISLFFIALWINFRNVYFYNSFTMLRREFQSLLVIILIYCFHLEPLSLPIFLFVLAIVSYKSIRKRKKIERVVWDDDSSV